MVSNFIGSGVLETVIGLAFIYFILSIVCSSIQEVISSLLARRAKDLEYGIAQMLGSTQLRAQLYNHPLIKALGTKARSSWDVGGSQGPGYMPADTFSMALFDLYAPAESVPQNLACLREAVLARAQSGEEAAKALLVLIDAGRGGEPLLRDAVDVRQLLAKMDDSPEKQAVLSKIDATMSLEQVRATLLALPASGVRTTALSWLDDTQKGMQAARANVEDWFNHAMDRVSGVYRRQVQYWLLGIAVVVVLLSGADTIRIWQSLQNSSTLRSYLDQQAALLVSAQAGNPGGNGPGLGATNTQGVKLDSSTIISLANTLDQLPGVLGYDWPQVQPNGGYRPDLTGWFFWKIVGLLLTVFAVSLGAPFWFDVLQRAANLRSAGPPPGHDSST